ncbi:MAG: Na(+)/H(+) antiporter subunit D, partial [Pseudomonadota bacterium]
GVLEHSGIKIPYFAFFAHDSGKRVKEAPLNMLVAMGITAFFCIAIGVFPGPLYSLLPFAVDYQPYTVSHVVSQLQLLMFAMLAFAILIKKGWYPAEMRSTVLNTDWIYRKALPWLIDKVTKAVSATRRHVLGTVQRRLERFIASVFKVHGPVGILARTWPTGSTVLWVAVLLGATLILYYF